MKDHRKQKEVDFYIDRTRETALRILKSIVLNPRIDDGEKIKYLHQIAAQHAELAALIAGKFPADVTYQVPAE